MNKSNRKNLYFSLSMLISFMLWTVALHFIDIRPIGPENSEVGLAALNEFFHNLIGVNMTLYTVTDWLGLVPIAVGAGFAMLGLSQWITRRSLCKVDYSIFVLGGFYVAVMAVYALFEVYAVNYRPVLINGCLEVSYPSSTTMLVMCVMPTTLMQFNQRIKSSSLRKTLSFVTIAFTLFMVIGRLISGVHWLSDIIGGALVSAGLVLMYLFFIRLRAV